MKVLVDTSVWSLALRKRSKQVNIMPSQVVLLRELIQDGRVVLFGAIRQELLSGIRTQKQYESLKLHLRAFPNLLLEVEDYELAADYFNVCRRQGVQGSNTDFLICAVASRRECSILTTDQDFDHFSKHIPVSLLRAE